MKGTWFKRCLLMLKGNMVLLFVVSLVCAGNVFGRGRIQVIDRHIVTDTGERLRGGDFRVLESDSSNIVRSSYASNYEDYFKYVMTDSVLNVVRITVRYPDWNRDPADFAQGVEAVIRWCEELDVYACLNLHTYYGQLIDVAGASEFWSYYADYEIDGVKLKDNPNVIFELSNEPIDSDRVAHTQELYDHVRALAPDTHLILFSCSRPGLIPASRISQLVNIDWTNTSVSAHCYGDEDAIASKWGEMDAIRAAGFPISVTEFKSKDENNNDIEWPLLMHNLKLAESRDTSWMHWDPKLNYYNAIAGDHLYDEEFKSKLEEYGIAFWGPVNVALEGTATQSSTDWEGLAERAIDGNTSGTWNNDSVTHTTTEPQPWWQVDLGDAHEIDEIEIWGRTDDGYEDRLSNYDVIVFDSENEQVWSSYQADYPDPYVSLQCGGITGQYVKVQLRGDSNPLSLAEVKVLVVPVILENIALNGTASQSSTDWGGDASRAIDNNLSGVWNNDSVTHTLAEPQPWWQLDLGAVFDIEEIRIWGRTDEGLEDRLSDYDIFVYGETNELVWSDYQADYPDPSVVLETGGAAGRYVMVQLRGDTNALSLAEVQVYGTETFPSQPNPSPDPVLVGEWTFDNQTLANSGSAGSVHDGIFMNSTGDDLFTTNTVSGLGYSLKLDSIAEGYSTMPGGEFLKINNSASGDVAYSNSFDSAAFSVAMWIKTDGAWSRWDELAGKGSESASEGWAVRARELGADDQDGLRFTSYSDNGTALDSPPYTVDLADQQWHLVTVVYDGSEMYIYLDENLVASAPEVTIFNTDAHALVFGARDDGSRGEDVLIDCIQFYDGALSDQEIADLFAEKAAYTPPVIHPEFTFTNGSVNFQFAGPTGQHYRVEYMEDLMSSNGWQVVTDIVSLAISPVQVSSPVTNSTGFYRIILPEE